MTESAEGAKNKGEILAELTLGVIPPNALGTIKPTFILFEKSDGVEKYGFTHKGLNRRIRKIIGRLTP